MNRDNINWDTDMLYTSMYQQGYVDVHSMSVSQSRLCSILCNPSLFILMHVCVPISSLFIFMQSLYYTSNFLIFLFTCNT